jgi:hypothetical protein
VAIAPVRPAPRAGGRTATPGGRAALRRALRAAAPALLLYAAARLAGIVAVLVWSGANLRTTHGLHTLGTLWDASWYLDVAQHGYDHHIRPPLPGHHADSTNLAFFPLYPLAIRAVHTVLPFLDWSGAGLLVSWTASLTAAWGVFAATAVPYGRRIATLTTLLWGVLPFAVIENAGYSESLFTACAAWCLWAVLTRRWLTAGALAVLAGLTRPTAVALVAAVAAAGLLEAARLLRARHPEAVRRPLLGALTAPLGWLGFVAWTGQRLGGWDAYFRIQKLWGSSFDFGRDTLHHFSVYFTTAAPAQFGIILVACTIIGYVLACAIASAQRQPLPFLVFSTVAVVIALGDSAAFSSRARFLLPLFPLLVPLASALARVRSRWTLGAVLTCATGFSALCGAYITYVYAYAP